MLSKPFDPGRTLRWALPLVGLSIGLTLAPTIGAAPADSTRPTEVSIPNSRKVDFVSRVNGHRYSLDIAFPFEPMPASGYAVLYVLDGYSYFGSATEAARGHGNAPEGVVVVGIGYPDDSAWIEQVMQQRGPPPNSLANLPDGQVAPQLERLYDLTLPASDRELAVQILPGSAVQKSINAGGVDDFLKTIETEVKPRVAALTKIDPSRQVLFGHSAGGLAALHALFTEPNAFSTFLISSPAIWWNNRAVLADEPRFAALVRAGKAHPHIMLSIGSEESTPPMRPAAWHEDPSAIAAIIRKARMVENGAELVTRLRALQGSPGFRVEDYVVFAHEGHNNTPWSALARGVTLAFAHGP